MWSGQAVYRGARLEFSIDFRRDGDSLRADFSSADLMILAQSLDSVAFARPRVRFTTRDDHPVRFEGVVAGDSIVGSAAFSAVPGVIASGDTARMRFALRRTLAPPPPYSTRHVRFRNGGVELGGTVYLPPGTQRVLPGVVILQGSSANLRHEYSFYVDHFARAGFAVLAFDKRGHGESTGDYAAATHDDLAGDAAAAVARLRAEPQVLLSRVGLWGLSQGAFIAPMVAARVDSLAFVVAVSPPGVTLGECASYQDSLRLVAAGFGAAQAESAAVLDRRITQWLAAGRHGDRLAHELERVADTPWRRASSIPRRLPRGAALEGWHWRGRTLDPLPAWRALRVPALVIFGDADELVPGPTSAANIERALGEGGHAHAQVKRFSAANHMLRTLPLVAGGAWDWPRAAPGYLELVTRWMESHARPNP
jgi:pimeloyl-ACP methyl ester carboxylesterase